MAASSEDRLAAFGEAFMSSLERKRPDKAARKAANKTPPASPALGARSPVLAPVEAVGAPGKKARKLRQKKEAQRKKKALKGTVAPPVKANLAPDEDAELAAKVQRATALVEAAFTGKSSAFAAVESVVQPASNSGTRAPATALKIPPRGPKVSAGEKRRFMSGDVSKMRAGPQEQLTRRGRTPKKVTEEEKEFNHTLREVLDYVTPQLGKDQRRQYENQKMRALGGTVEKSQKMPYSKLQADRKQGDATRLRKMEHEKTMGVATSASKHRKTWAIERQLKLKKEGLKDKKRRQEDGLLRIGMGAKESRGMAIIPKRVLKSSGVNL